MACERTIYALKPKKECSKYKMFVGCTTQTLDDRFAHHMDWNKTRDLELYFAMERDGSIGVFLLCTKVFALWKKQIGG